MKLKESIVFVLLVVGVIAAMGGFALVSRGVTYGWAGVALAVPIILVLARNMRLQPSASSSAHAVAPAPATARASANAPTEGDV
jgi:hypothetical protein